MSLEEELKPFIDPRWTFNMTVSINAGWEHLVLTLHNKLVEIDPNYRIAQIKEKFGGLRYYADPSTRENGEWDQFRDLINKAEEESYSICENCSTTENVTTDAGKGRWILTLCVPCRAEREERRAARDAELKLTYPHYFPDYRSDNDEG